MDGSPWEALAEVELHDPPKWRADNIVPCPKCGAAPGRDCTTTSGARASKSHRDRATVARFMETQVAVAWITTLAQTGMLDDLMPTVGRVFGDAIRKAVES